MVDLAVKPSLTADTIKGFVEFFHGTSCLSLAACWAGLCLQLGAPSDCHLPLPAGCAGRVTPSCQQCAQIVSWGYEMPGTRGPALPWHWSSPSLWVCWQLSCQGRLRGGSSWSSRGFASLIALPSLCHKAPPKKGWQNNATDVLLMKCGRTGALLVRDVLSGVGEHSPNLGCQRTGASASLHWCWFSCGLCYVFLEVKEKLQVFQKR